MSNSILKPALIGIALIILVLVALIGVSVMSDQEPLTTATPSANPKEKQEGIKNHTPLPDAEYLTYDNMRAK